MDNVYEPAIHFSHVNFQTGDTKIIKDVTGSFPRGKITTLVGPSGAGKTTLLKMCNGLISPTAGEIFIHNELITTYDPIDLRRNVGMALQAAPMIKGTVFENLELPLALQNKELLEENAISYLEDVGLERSFLHKDADELSGGQRQKVSIARTLVNQSEILLLDEITSALDRASVKEIEDLIVKINKKYNVTMIWITHNLDQALKIGHFAWVLMKGELIETGESKLLEDPQNELVRRFVQGVIK
ncbi:ABC transporter ATP-binding protein [Viridibacillus sp. NPDC096237]|uniref:ABC transporter ATP-binding protein n=1 Tax=Viridibacillus sp. NPDC096237 TaxID=3390721 RepID=UPI003D08A660